MSSTTVEKYCTKCAMGSWKYAPPAMSSTTPPAVSVLPMSLPRPEVLTSSASNESAAASRLSCMASRVSPPVCATLQAACDVANCRRRARSQAQGAQARPQAAARPCLAASGGGAATTGASQASTRTTTTGGAAGDHSAQAPPSAVCRGRTCAPTCQLLLPRARARCGASPAC